MTEYNQLQETLYEDLSAAIRQNVPGARMDLIRDAYDFAWTAHEGQKRRDGTPYATHVVAAAKIAAQMGLDDEALAACLLHDTLEDTPVDYDTLKKRFGKPVADIVEGVTKLTRVQFSTKEEAQMENLRKMLLAMSNDIRVILIKIADRLHNMRTMEFQSPEKQREKSRETMEIYAPIAHRLGIQKLKQELEDLSLRYLDPVGYKEIINTLSRRMEIMRHFLTGMEQRIRERLNEENIRCDVYGRIKHTYSIYRKMYAQRLGIEEIFDLCGMRVIVDSVADCYNVLGIVHEMFRPVPGRFKDYISTPKPNGYQSLHTTLIGSEGIPFEIQIRTREMHLTAEYGVAAHWKYKTGETGVGSGDVQEYAWIRRLLENQADTDEVDFFHDLSVDMFNDEVFVFTPNGDVKSLPAGATPIDFAYSIHSAVGNRMVGAKINGRIVPLTTALSNGDIVDIITSNNATGPSRDWLSIARSGEARSKIRQWFKKEKREENIVQGRAMFESEIRRYGLTMAEITDAEMLPAILKKLAVVELDDLFASIGYGGMTAAKAANRVRDELNRQRSPKNKTELDKMQERAERREQHAARAMHGVLVEGLDNCLIKFAYCCTPVPGDPIVGFITRGSGVSIHRRDCVNCRQEENSGRWISVNWASTITDFYLAELRITGLDRPGLLLDIATVLNALNARVRSLNCRSVGRGDAAAVVRLEVQDVQELVVCMNRLRAIRGITDIVRVGTEERKK